MLRLRLVGFSPHPVANPRPGGGLDLGAGAGGAFRGAPSFGYKEGRGDPGAGDYGVGGGAAASLGSSAGESQEAGVRGDP